MKVDIDYKWGQSIYLVNDSDQVEFRLNRIILEPKGRITLELLSPSGEMFEVPEIHTTKEIDILKKTTDKNSETD